ncbi:MAG: hypothetical protein AB8F26_11755 [Phycisphaerales bacterium]
MTIYEITKDEIVELEESSFGANQIRERDDLQRLLRENIEIISPGTLVVAEEFGQWEDSRRRIDLLGVDADDARLVVIELKRTSDGGHMELQALRYAAMASTMTYAKVVEIFSAYLETLGRDEDDAEEVLLRHLGWDEPKEEDFAQDVRIVLAAADFSKELTTAVMWLNERELDITCVRLNPYKLEDRVLLDVQQVVPLPEAADYQIRIAQKQSSERASKRSVYHGDSKHLAAAIEAYLSDEIGCPFTQRQGKRVKFLTEELDQILPSIGTSWPRLERRTPFVLWIQINNGRPGLKLVAELGSFPNRSLRKQLVSCFREVGCSIDRRGDRIDAVFTRCNSATHRFSVASIDQVSEQEAIEQFAILWGRFQTDLALLIPVLTQTDWKQASVPG